MEQEIRQQVRVAMRALHQLLAFAVAALFLLPFLWMITASLRPVALPPPQSIQWWPEVAAWGNYRTIFEMVPLGRFTLNSLLVAGVAVPVTCGVTSWAGLAMAQLPDPAQRRLLLLSIVLLMIPATAFWLFRFQIYRWLGILGSLWALIVPAFAGSSPLFVLLFYWTFRRQPAELYEAARLDGASALTIWRAIALPMSLPTIAGVLVLTFVMYWSDFINPVLYLRFQESYTLPVGLQILKQMDATNWPLLMAASVVMTVPVLLLFLFTQRFFLRDIALPRVIKR